MVEYDAAVPDVHDRVLGIADGRLLRDDLSDTSRAGRRHGDHDEHHGEHHQAHQDVHAVSEKTHQGAGGQLVRNDHMCADPAYEKDDSVYHARHDRRHSGEPELCFHEHEVNIRRCLLELIDFIVLTHIRFDDADGGDVLLNTLVQKIVFLEDLLEIVRRRACDERDDDTEDDNRNEINGGNARAQHVAHDHGYDHGHRRAHSHTQNHLISVLHIRDISCKTRDKTRC